jgi:16S rRNA (cytidine1402-2'-O)-methyltransferase
MPLLSDPGYGLVKKCLELDFNVVCLPGPSAGITGLLMSGMKPHPYLFYGFLDSKTSKRKKTLETLKYREETLIFYEAPHRISALMQDVAAVFGSRDVVLAKEISKKYEEVISGAASELASLTDLKGEFVVVIEGYQSVADELRIEDTIKAVDEMINSGYSKVEAMKKVAAMSGIPKNKIYKEYLEKTGK